MQKLRQLGFNLHKVESHRAQDNNFYIYLFNRLNLCVTNTNII